MLVIADNDLDLVLALQISLAWVGERGDPPRLGWWNTDLVDENAGGDLFQRLLPRTGAWAALASVREVARRTDAEGRKALGDPDQLFTAFCLGFELDERLDDRLLEHKRRGTNPATLPWPLSLERYSLAEARAAFRRGKSPVPDYTVVAGGRQLKQAMPSSAPLALEQLAAVLFATDPMPEKYPLAFFRARA